MTNSKAKLWFDSEDVKREMEKEIEKHMAQHVVPWEVLIASSKVTFDYWTWAQILKLLDLVDMITDWELEKIIAQDTIQFSLYRANLEKNNEKQNQEQEK